MKGDVRTKESITTYRRSPLRYAGGKSRGASEILGFIPHYTTTMCSPFLGGGAVEIACASKGILVYGYDKFKPLMEFWECLLADPSRLADIVREYHPLERDLFYELQRSYTTFHSKWQRAAIYFVLNRSSFSGCATQGGMSPGHPRFTKSAIMRLERFEAPNILVKMADFTESIPHHYTFMYLDPPYMIDQKLYGYRGERQLDFDHIGLARILHNRDNWILSYNDSPLIHDLYDGYYFHHPHWRYGMSKDKNSREVLIMSHDVARYNGLI